jgi:hypothetical protein
MNKAVLNIAVYDRFQVLDANDAAVTGIANGSFTKRLWRPDGTEVSGSVTVTVSELSNGYYEATFTPNVAGLWLLEVSNATYMPEGASEIYFVRAADIALDGEYDSVISTLQTDVTFIKDIEGGKWEITNDQMIFYKSDNTTEVARFNLYKDGVLEQNSPDRRDRV